MSESSISSGSNSLSNSGLNSPTEDTPEPYPDLSNAIHDLDSKSSSATITPVTKSFPKPLFDTKTLPSGDNSVQSTSPEHRPKVQPTSQRTSTVVSRTNSNDLSNKTPRLQKADSENQSFMQHVGDELNSSVAGRVVSNMAKMATNKMSELLDAPRHSITSMPRANRPPPFPFPKPNRKVEKPSLVKQTLATSSNLIRQQSVESKANTHSENQQFLKDIVNNVLDGQGIGWLKINRVKKLMEDENYRNFVLSRLNTNLDKKYSDEDDHIEDVVREISFFAFFYFVSKTKQFLRCRKSTVQYSKA